jgi:MarR family transcriptional regulator, 2-MHQ and catechol-resistance regulon repressor
MDKRTCKSDQCSEEAILTAIVRTAETFKRAQSGVLRNFGLSFQQHNVLKVVGDFENGRKKVSDVSRMMHVPGANLSVIVKRLTKDGFIIKKFDPDDERVTLLEITPKGKRALKHIEKEKDDCPERMLRDFSDNEKVELLSKVKRILRNEITTMAGNNFR